MLGMLVRYVENVRNSMLGMLVRYAENVRNSMLGMLVRYVENVNVTGEALCQHRNGIRKISQIYDTRTQLSTHYAVHDHGCCKHNGRLSVNSRFRRLHPVDNSCRLMPKLYRKSYQHLNIFFNM